MKQLLVFISLFLLTIFCYAQKGGNDLIKVALIKNNGDTVYVKSKAAYYNEHSFNSFGYYNEDGSRGRAYANEYKMVIIRNKKLESVKLKSTAKNNCKKQVFLERIIDGPMIMYTFHYVKQMVYTSKCIDEIYIRKTDEECAYPLFKKLCPHEVLTIISQPNNKNDMMRIFSDVPDIIDKIESGYYHRSDYESIVREYNRKVSQN
ncbi:MAG TPA: hypothetical protein DCG75_12675 [Bacteroidales bacterium]|nr:hypothetical protein [Bacteroidales bacterium]